MSNFAILKPILKSATPMLASMPVAQQSEVVVDIERWLSRWLERKQETIVLAEQETELVLMFRLVDNELLMIPCTLGDNDGTDYVARAFVEQGVNVTRMAAQVPAFQLLPMILGEDTKSPAGKLKMQQAFIALLRAAAHHPDARIDTETETPFTETETPFTPTLEVDALGAHDDDYEEDDGSWLLTPVETSQNEQRYEITQHDEWIALAIEEQDEVLAEIGLTRDQLVQSQQ